MDWGLAFATTATGLVVVFAVLVILIIIVSVLGKIMEGLTGKPKKKGTEAEAVKAPEQAEETAAVQVETEDGISEETVAALSAAIAVIMSAEGKAYRIRSVKRVREIRPVWGAAGIQENTRPF